MHSTPDALGPQSRGWQHRRKSMCGTGDVFMAPLASDKDVLIHEELNTRVNTNTRNRIALHQYRTMEEPARLSARLLACTNYTPHRHVSHSQHNNCCRRYVNMVCTVCPSMTQHPNANPKAATATILNRLLHVTQQFDQQVQQ